MSRRLRDVVAFGTGGGIALVLVGTMFQVWLALAAGLFVVGCGLIAWWWADA